VRPSPYGWVFPKLLNEAPCPAKRVNGP